MTNLIPTGKQQYFYPGTASPLAGGKMYTYDAGASTPKATYQDAAGTIANSNPVLLDATGSAVVYWSGNYKIIFQDALGNTVYTIDNYNVDPTGLLGKIQEIQTSAGSSLVGFTAGGAGTTSRSAQDKLRERVSIDDYDTLHHALDAIGGTDGTGYSACPVVLDLLGKNITFADTLYWPINVKFVNGTLTSLPNAKLVLRNPFLANTKGPAYTEYWPYMKAGATGVKFDCMLILNCYIGALFENCDFTGQQSAVVHVNSNGLWTEYNTYLRCSFASNTSVGAAVLFDGNLSGNSPYSTGSNPGTPDGSFGYTKFIASKIDSTAPNVGIKVIDGAVLYNGKLGFDGYARGVGAQAGAFLYVTNAQVAHCDFSVNLESFATTAYIIRLDTNGTLAYCVGEITSASPEMTFSQATDAAVTNCSVGVVGAVLQDKTGTVIRSGDTVKSTIRTHLLERLDYFTGNTYVLDTVVANGALESHVQYTGQITSRPDDNRSVASRNWAWRANNTAFGDYVLLESTSNKDDPANVRLQVQSGGACFNTTGTWGALSDTRLKENIVDARNYLEDLRKLRVVRYSLIEDNLDHPNLLGVLAQQVEQVFPSLVSTDVNPDTGKETKQVKTSVLTFMLLKAVQELAAKIDPDHEPTPVK